MSNRGMMLCMIVLRRIWKPSTRLVLVLAEYGEIEEVVVVDNTIDYMLGNVYVRYRHERSASAALVGLTGRYYFGKLISAEYSPVADFREARCRAHHETRCSRVGACRFLHIKHVPKAVKRRVARQMYKEHPEFLTGSRRNDKKPENRAMAKMNLLDDVDRPNRRGRRREEDPYMLEDGGDAYDPEDPAGGPRKKNGRRFTEGMEGPGMPMEEMRE